MKLQTRFLVLLVVLFQCVPVIVQAGVEFSADTVEEHPQSGTRSGKLYVGDNRVRTEYEMNGEQFIQILDLTRQQAVLINTAKKSYIRQQAGAGQMQRRGDKASTNPCENMQHLECHDAGAETIDGRATHKWEIGKAGQPGKMQFWVDEQSGMPLRQVMPDGSRTEMHLLNQETVNGRNAEKWELVSHQANGDSQKVLQWYDPELKIIIREQQPGGISRNLMNIKPGKQPDTLFSVPPDYTEITVQQPVQ